MVRLAFQRPWGGRRAMGIFDKLFRKGPPKDRPPAASEHAVLVHLDGTSLPDEVYEENDLVTLEDRIIAAVTEAATGEFDGDELVDAGATIFLYGPDADALFASVEPVLRIHPLCRNARVEIRRGGPGAPQREVRLPPA
jgi:hypothetical protein